MSRLWPVFATVPGTSSAIPAIVMQRSATMRRFVSFSVVALVLGLLATPPASAQQSLNLYLGGFVTRSEDARDRNDVLLNNLNFLAFNIKDFTAATVGGEWLVGLGNNLEGSLGVGFHTRTVPAVYLNFVNTNGSEIEQ